MLNLVTKSEIMYEITIGNGNRVLMSTNDKSKAIKYSQLLSHQLGVDVSMRTIKDGNIDGLAVSTKKTKEEGNHHG